MAARLFTYVGSSMRLNCACQNVSLNCFVSPLPRLLPILRIIRQWNKAYANRMGADGFLCEKLEYILDY